MKKVVFLLAVMATLSFVACNGNKTTSTEVSTDSLSTPVDSLKTDSLKVDSVKTSKTVIDTVTAGC